MHELLGTEEGYREQQETELGLSQGLWIPGQDFNWQAVGAMGDFHLLVCVWWWW